jgi:hypothetical protein
LHRVELDGFQIQAPVGGEHTYKGEIKEIEAGDAPVVIFIRGHGKSEHPG